MRVNRFFQFLFALTVIGILNGEVQSQEPTLTDVLASCPNRPNAILYADITSLRALTPGSLFHSDLPESMGEVRIASELNLKTIEPSWEIGYVTLKGWKNAETLAKTANGYIDNVAGRTIIWTPRQSYLIPSTNDVFGIVRPADRKMVSRWLSNEGANNASTYLKKHAIQGSKYISMLMAVDLQDAWSPIALAQKIENFDSLKGMDIKSVAATLASVQGVRIIVGRKSLNECIISLDFGTSPANLLPVAKNFFIEALRRNQSSMPETSQWTATMDGNTIAFRGSITVETLDHLVGIFSVQGQAAGMQAPGVESLKDFTNESSMLETSKSYFAQTTNIINRVRDYSAKNTGDRARLNGLMARRIDDLPTLNVDPELVNFGVAVAQGLRGNMVALQQTNIQVGAVAAANNAGNPQVSVYGYNGGYYGGYGYAYNYDPNSSSRYNAMAQAQGNYSYKELIAEIDSMEADIRRKMTQKYKVQF